MKTKVIIIAAATLITVLLTGCAARGMSGEKEAGYQQISQEEAASMMEKDYGHIILDVRRRDEYASGHIPGAICIPNETITTDMLPQLPDPEQVILVYCRSGNRSKQASGKLAENEKEESEEELRARIGDLAFEVTQHAATEYAFRGQ